jgi:hypothetical protein
MRIIKRVAIILVGLLIIFASPALASTGPSASAVHLRGSNVVHYGTARDGATVIVRGVRLSNSRCSFTLSGSGLAAQGGERLDEVAFDPTTCQSELQSGSLGDGAQPPDGSAGGGQGGVAQEVSGGPSPDYGGTANCPNPYEDNSNYYPDERCIHSWFTDPVNIHVNDLTNEVQWTPGSGCANHGRNYETWYAQWLATTGWALVANQFVPSASCSNVTSKSNTGFANTVFCALTLTTTTYGPQVIQGFASGTYTWSVSWTKGGLCSGLLTFHTQNS